MQAILSNSYNTYQNYSNLNSQVNILGEGAEKYSVLGHTARATALHSPNITQTIQLFAMQ
jgi:hypothetical protein